MKQNSVAKHLREFFRRNGYVRWQDPTRVNGEGRKRYKKGDEVRLVANSVRELRLMRRLLREAGFTPGRHFTKGSQYRLPLYGRDEVARFLELIGA